jgi:hypothetical protein
MGLSFNFENEGLTFSSRSFLFQSHVSPTLCGNTDRYQAIVNDDQSAAPLIVCFRG